MSKKFSWFYLNRFRPITLHEHRDVERSRNMYRYGTVFGALTAGFMSLRYRKMKISGVEYYNMAKEPDRLGFILTDAFWIMMGYVGTHLFCCDYIYKHR